MENELLQQIGWLWIPLAWLVAASMTLLVAMSRGLPQVRWLLAAFLLAPVALIGCCLPRKWLLPGFDNRKVYRGDRVKVTHPD